jgi:hypothetical protein
LGSSHYRLALSSERKISASLMQVQAKDDIIRCRNGIDQNRVSIASAGVRQRNIGHFNRIDEIGPDQQP